MKPSPPFENSWIRPYSFLRLVQVEDCDIQLAAAHFLAEISKMAESQEKAAESTSKTLVLVGHGGFDKLKVQQKERPKPGQGELLVNVKATGINFAELMARQGMFAHTTWVTLLLAIFEWAW